ncbi:flagellar biosynthesis anti-sigma factor FlgM [Acidocella sp.]|uniref:flagellar biosynthesis anti-sigma factor FlgM n=1 Tax=Acidocella sp. TaxID=50710 RepID=UPI0026029EEE|nr:flagellar biosynthesis anti-sigma factor FlgM [Acidocella sp.]
MSNIVSSVSSRPVRDVAEAAAPPASAPASQGVAEAGGEIETVNISQNAQNIASLFEAAQQAEGVDEVAIKKIKDKLAAGSYNVSTHDLARAIISVLKEMNS